MSSFSVFPSAIPDYQRVRVVANLGALFDCPGVSVPHYNVPQTTPPFPLQQLDIGTPLQLYQSPALYLPTASNTHNTLTANNLHYPNYLSPSPITSREATPSSTTTTTPDIYSAIHTHAMNYFQMPMQQLNTNEVVATQQVPQVTPVGEGSRQSAPPRKHHKVNKTTTAGPIRGSTSNRRPTHYTRPAASTSSRTTNLRSGWDLSAKAMSRLAIQGVCKINGCEQIFTSADVYLDHVRDFHHIKKGKSGREIFLCPWEGCGESKSEAALSNHILGHNTRSGCRLCDGLIMGARTDSVQKHYRTNHKDTHADVLIHSNARADYCYLFFSDSEGVQ